MIRSSGNRHVGSAKETQPKILKRSYIVPGLLFTLQGGIEPTACVCTMEQTIHARRCRC